MDIVCELEFEFGWFVYHFLGGLWRVAVGSNCNFHKTMDKLYLEALLDECRIWNIGVFILDFAIVVTSSIDLKGYRGSRLQLSNRTRPGDGGIYSHRYS